MKSSFITWLPHCASSDALALKLGGKSHLIHYLGFKKPWQAILKYPLQAAATFVHLFKDKPDLVLVASPPVIAALPVYFYARIRNIPFVIDAHTGVFDDPRWAWMLPVSRWLSRAATVTIVTNDHLARVVESWGAQTLVLHCLPMALTGTQHSVSKGHINIVLVNTFSRDEPVDAVVNAAKNIPNVPVYITGNIERAPRDLLQAAPPNVRFTGWLSDEEYAGLLRSATVVMVLTTRDHTFQRGANEALELEKPLITSDWPLLRQAFSKGTVHVDNTVTGITNGIQTAIRDHDSLALEMKVLRQERNAEFETKLRNLLVTVKNHPYFFSQSRDERKTAGL